MLYSFSAVVRMHRDSSLARGLSSATVRWYDAQLGAFDQWRRENGFPDVLPDAATIEQFIAAEHARGLRPRSVHARYRALGAILNFAQRRRMLDQGDNPLAVMEAPRIPRERPRHVDLDVMRRLLNAAGGDSWLDQRDRLIFLLLFYCGLRVGELVALRVADIDVAKGELFVRRGKGAKPRMVPLAPDVRRALVPYIYARPSTSEWLLVAGTARMKAGKTLTSDGVRSMLRRRCEQAGIESWNAHAFRHGCAMFLRNTGTDLSDIAAILGHTTTQVTQMYYAFTLAPTVRRAYFAALDRLKEEEGE